MFCQNCGSKVDDDAVFCTKCGANLKTNVQNQAPQARPSVQAAATAPANATNTIAIVGFILSFFIALAGLICCIVGYNNTKKGAPYKGLSIAGIVISAINMFLGFVIVIASI